MINRQGVPFIDQPRRVDRQAEGRSSIMNVAVPAFGLSIPLSAKK